jgi:asparagine synthase (glutamine-hydrolysing)
VNEVKTDSHETTFTAEDVLMDLDELVDTQEEPFTGLSPYGQFRVMKLASKNGMKVLLDGQGGDELLGGYVHFFPYYYLDLLRAGRFIPLLREIWTDYRRRKDLSQVYRFGGLLLPGWLKLLVVRRWRGYLARSFLSRHSSRTDLRLGRKSLNEALVNALACTSLPALLRLEDKNSMHWSIESRVPFLDLRLAEFCIDSPPELKIANGTTKVTLRESLAGLVPPDILNRKDKVGFAVPDDLAVHGPMSRLIRDVIQSESFRNRPYWDWKKVQREFESYFERSTTSRSFDEIWRLFVLELWLRHWIDN